MSETLKVGQKVHVQGQGSRVGVIQELYSGGAYVYFADVDELSSFYLEALEAAE